VEFYKKKIQALEVQAAEHKTSCEKIQLAINECEEMAKFSPEVAALDDSQQKFKKIEEGNEW